ncbi:MAG: ATP phosphoribosyltransferase regulatory subunit, partial [Oscillospiraceae bacterium]
MESLNADEDMREQIRISIETKNYPELNDLLDSFGDKYEANVLKQLPRLFGGEDVFLKARELINNEATINILSYLKKLYTY